MASMFWIFTCLVFSISQKVHADHGAFGYGGYTYGGRFGSLCATVICEKTCQLRTDRRGCDFCDCPIVSPVGPCAVTDCAPGHRCVELPAQCPNPPCNPPVFARCVTIESPLPPPPDGQCSLPPVRGLCEAHIPRWFYNKFAGQCESFIYGGCGGNGNNFKSRNNCDEACPDRAPSPLDPSCPLLDCQLASCEFGPVVDNSGCATCECAINPCALALCPEGQVCVPLQVQCIRAPCPPVANCIDAKTRPGFCPVGINPTCDFINNVCVADEECQPTKKCCQIGCQRRCSNTLPFPPPLPPTPVDVLPQSSCANVRCPSGSHCVEEIVQCITTPCNPVVKCVPSDETKSGYCPGGSPPPSCQFLEVDCAEDSSCPGTQKCCKIECEQRCVNALTLPPPHPPPIDPQPPLTCANVLCIQGTACIEEPVQCIRAPCFPIPRCVPFDNKPGLCPPLPPGSVGICIQGCNGDSGCPDGEKCCSNGCGNVCQAPVFPLPSSKPGLCPLTTLPPIPPGQCDDVCTSDESCAGTLKCCTNINGCGRSCLEPRLFPVKPTQATPSVSNPDPTVPEVDGKPGVCPTVPEGVTGTCFEMCDRDTSCPGMMKCCSNGCGHLCVEAIPDFPSLPVKPESCPPQSLKTSNEKSCVKHCTQDINCAGLQKCCQTGCSKVCSPPVSIQPPQFIAGPPAVGSQVSENEGPIKQSSGYTESGPAARRVRKCFGTWCIVVDIKSEN